MVIKRFSIGYDSEVYYPGQTIHGRVHLSVDKLIKMRSIQLTLYGKAKVHWTEYRDESNRYCKGKEEYFKTTLELLGDDREKSVLPTGDYEYPFSATIPANSPPTFEGKYGGIMYAGKAELDLVGTFDKIVEKHFIVEKPIDLNKFTKPYRLEKSETFWSWCDDSAPLTATVCISRMGFVRGEAIPITINVDNASKVEIYCLKIELNQIIKWIARRSSKKKKANMDFRHLDGVHARTSKTWTVELDLCSSTYPNSGDCSIIKIEYELAIKIYPRGPHTCVKIKTPITIGDMVSGGSLPDSSVRGTGLLYFGG